MLSTPQPRASTLHEVYMYIVRCLETGIQEACKSTVCFAFNVAATARFQPVLPDLEWGIIVQKAKIYHFLTKVIVYWFFHVTFRKANQINMAKQWFARWQIIGFQKLRSFFTFTSTQLSYNNWFIVRLATLLPTLFHTSLKLGIDSLNSQCIQIIQLVYTQRKFQPMHIGYEACTDHIIVSENAFSGACWVTSRCCIKSLLADKFSMTQSNGRFTWAPIPLFMYIQCSSRISAII